MTYKMTPARRAALRKAQAASARKRRGKGKGKLAAANRQISKNRRRNKILKYAAIAATTGAVGYGAHKSYSTKNRKESAIKTAKDIQKNNRDNFRKAQELVRKNPNDKRARSRLRAARRMLRISSSRSVHNAIIKQHTGR